MAYICGCKRLHNNNIGTACYTLTSAYTSYSWCGASTRKKHGEKTTNRINKPIVNVYGVHTYAYARALYRVGMAQAPQTAYISHSWRKFVTSLTFFAKLLDTEILWLYNGTMFDEYRRNKNFYEKLHVLYNGTSIAANLFEAL